MGYSGAIRWLYDHVDYERLRVIPYNSRTFGLERIRKVLAKMDNPHADLKIVQVAGSKGKGSTCAMLASMLQACGYTVGVYSSPHLVDLRERITIDGQWISQQELTELIRSIATAELVLGEPGLSFYEVLTVAAFQHFADQAVDVAVMETGLGGRLDAVTVAKPLACGITRISLDHMNVLGNDLVSIAKEKAGIFKKDIPAVSVAQEESVAEALNESAGKVGTTLEYTGGEINFSYRFEANRELGPHTRVSITTPHSQWEHLAVPLPGEHQGHNCALALALLDKLKGYGFLVPDDKVISGLAQTKLPGRMEQVWDEPRVLIDGAHNAASIHALIRALGAHIRYDSLVMIFGCAADKDVEGMLKQVSLGADKVIFTRAKANPRALEPEDLIAKFSEVSGKMAQHAPGLAEALQLAGRAVSREDLILITGSFYLAGEAKKHFESRSEKA